MKPEDFRADAKRPLTGEEYLKSLQDGREIYIYGERVKDVTTHPAFRNAGLRRSAVRCAAQTGDAGFPVLGHRYRQRRLHP
jgi:hypothetical protein